MTTISFVRMATVTASTKRNPVAVAGKTGLPTIYLTGLKILPLMPVSKEIIERYQLKSPRETYVTYTEGAPDIVESDVLIIGSAEYKIAGASPWPSDQAFIELVIEKVIGA